MKPLSILFLFPLLFGCAIAVETYLPNGQKGYVINCNGAGNNWGKCYQKAGETCGSQGYTVVSKDEEEGFVSEGSAEVNSEGGTANTFSGTTVSRTLMIGCGSS